MNTRVIIGDYTFVAANKQSKSVSVIGRGICKQMNRSDAEEFFRELRTRYSPQVMPAVHRVQQTFTNCLRHK
jgi:hypothetical protein